MNDGTRSSVISHPGTYTDHCIIERVAKQGVYIVAADDWELKGRIRRIPDVLIVNVGKGKDVVERLPDVLKVVRGIASR